MVVSNKFPLYDTVQEFNTEILVSQLTNEQWGVIFVFLMVNGIRELYDAFCFIIGEPREEGFLFNGEGWSIAVNIDSIEGVEEARRNLSREYRSIIENL